MDGGGDECEGCDRPSMLKRWVDEADLQFVWGMEDDFKETAVMLAEVNCLGASIKTIYIK